MVNEIAKVDKQPRMEGRQMSMMLSRGQIRHERMKRAENEN